MLNFFSIHRNVYYEFATTLTPSGICRKMWQIWVKSGNWKKGFCTMIKHLFTLLC